MALQDTDLLAIYRESTSTNHKLTIDKLKSFVGDSFEVPSDINPPSDAEPGDLWFNETDGRLYYYYDDGNSQQWVDANPASSGGGGASVEVSDTEPANPSEGDLWWDSSTDSGQLYIYYVDANSSQWVEASPSSGGGGGDASDLQAVTDAGNTTTNGATFGGGNIELAADGSATFAGKVTSASTVAGDDGTILTTKDYVDTAAGGGGAWTQAGNNLYPSTATSDVKIGGTLPASPNIKLGASGSAEFLGRGRFGDVTTGYSGGPAVSGYANTSTANTGVLQGKQYGTGALFAGFNATGTNTVSIMADGSASLGNITVNQEKNTTGLQFIAPVANAGDYMQIGFTSTPAPTATHSAIRVAYDSPGLGAASSIQFWTTNPGGGPFTEKMRMGSAGSLLVGTTTALHGSTAHCIAGDETISGVGALAVLNTNTTASRPAASFSTATDSTATSNFIVKFFVNSFGDGPGSLAGGSGAIVADGTSACAFATYSDARLKENIVNLPSQWENIKSLRPVEFDFKRGGHQIGFIAQEFENVYPDAVSSAPSEENPEEERLTITGWSKTEAYLVKALQEAITKIETLETKVAELSAEVEALKTT